MGTLFWAQPACSQMTAINLSPITSKALVPPLFSLDRHVEVSYLLAADPTCHIIALVASPACLAFSPACALQVF